MTPTKRECMNGDEAVILFTDEHGRSVGYVKNESYGDGESRMWSKDGQAWYVSGQNNVIYRDEFSDLKPEVQEYWVIRHKDDPANILDSIIFHSYSFAEDHRAIKIPKELFGIWRIRKLRDVTEER